MTVNVNDPITISDVPMVTITPLFISVNDSFTTQENIEKLHKSFININDGFAVSDSAPILFLPTLVVNVNDVINIVEVILRTISTVFSIFPSSPVPDNVLPIKIAKDRITSESESGYQVVRHRSAIGKRSLSLSYKNITLAEKDALRDYIIQQDMGLTPFLFKHPIDDLTKYISSNQDGDLELNDESVGNIGQGFVVPIQTAIHKVKIYLKKIGTPSGQLILKLEMDSSGKPSDAVMSIAENVPVSTVGSSYSLIQFDFATPVRFEPFTAYQFVLEGDSTYDSSFVTGVTAVQLGVDENTPSYASGNISTNTSGVWTTDATKNAIFTIPDYIKMRTEESSFADERISGAEGGIYNLAIALMEAL